MTPIAEASDSQSKLKLRECAEVQFIRGIPYPARIRFRQLVITGPPGCGKSSATRAIGGWTEEGYLDLSERGWWRSRTLAFRPREVHLVFPFRDYPLPLVVHEEEWIRAPAPPILEIDRIRLPPPDRIWSPWKWRWRHAFEFLLPPAENVFAVRQERSRRQSHPVDAELTLDRVRGQLDVYAQVARLFHHSGMIVLVRDGFGQAPKIIDEGVVEGTSPWEQPRPRSRIEKLEGAWERFTGTRDAPVVEPSTPMHLSGNGIKLRHQSLPVALVLGAQKLEMHADLSLHPSGTRPSGGVLVFDPEEYTSRISGFIRLEPGDRTRIGKGWEDRFITPSFPDDIMPRLDIVNDGKVVTLTDLHSPTGTEIVALSGPGQADRLVRDRRRHLGRIRDVFGGDIQPLDDNEALACIHEVIDNLRADPRRPRDFRGSPGGLLELPSDLVPVIIGDLHASLDNLLKILSENRFLDDLERGRACVIILGDAVHLDDQQHLEEMDSSLLMTDFILKLMRAFPDRFIYLRGTHESFSYEVTKGGVAQGQIWKERVAERRGEEFLQQLGRFYEALPYVAISEDFVACHAGPPVEQVSRQQLIDIHRHPRLMYQLTWNRLRAPNNPAGYTKREVGAFKKAVGLERSGAFIVSHNPPHDGNTVWMNVGGIQGHHLVFSGEKDKLAILTRIRGELTPLIYRTEPMLAIANATAPLHSV